ncbi:MAG TPA: hypothetical protein VHO49_01325 [Anaerolineales bacterium]|nr:hypothetical protein [Anaerolineales bacterium]
MFTVLYHSLLIGAALFVPVPFLDERLAAFLWKRMITDLAKKHGRTLTNDQLLALSFVSRFELSDGCLFVARRIFRELLQEIVFILEWRKAIHLASDAYYSGYLLNALFAYEGFDPAKAGQYALALQKAKQGTNMKLVQGVFKGTFRSGKGVLVSVARWLSSISVGYVKDSLARRKNKRKGSNVSEEQMESFFEMHRNRFQTLLKDLILQLQTGIGNLPHEHFDRLRERLFNEISVLETS